MMEVEVRESLKDAMPLDLSSGRSHKATECRQLLGTREGKETDFAFELPEEMQSC